MYGDHVTTANGKQWQIMWWVRWLTGRVPNHQSLTWSQMALAADMALESLRALITAAPLCWMVYEHNTKEGQSCTLYITIEHAFDIVYISISSLSLSLSLSLPPLWCFFHLDEVSLEPGVIVDCLVDWLLSVLNIGMGDVWELGGRVVAPDSHVPHFVSSNTDTCRDLIMRKKTHYDSTCTYM